MEHSTVVVRPVSARPGKLIQAYCSREEYALIEAAAAAESLRVSAWLRRTALRIARATTLRSSDEDLREYMHRLAAAMEKNAGEDR